MLLRLVEVRSLSVVPSIGGSLPLCMEVSCRTLRYVPGSKQHSRGISARKTRDKADMPLLPGNVLLPRTKNLTCDVLLALYTAAGTGLLPSSRCRY